MRNVVHFAAASFLVTCAAPPDPDAERRDAPVEGVPSSPQTIGDLVSLLDSLPRPTTLADFIGALPHPLTLSATSSQLSLQPAVDSDDPRIFIISGNLVLSVVPTGPQVNDLEIGDMSNGKMSPAHISFPLDGPLAPADPYKGVLEPSGTRTVCAKCHEKTAREVQIATVSGIPVFADSQRLPLRPFDVPVTSLLSLAQSCDPSLSAERCAILDALTHPGPPHQYSF